MLPSRDPPARVPLLVGLPSSAFQRRQQRRLIDPDTFTSKLEELGKSSSTYSTQALTAVPPMIAGPRHDQPVKTPPRLVSDQLINIFFQEWAPLYPVVHRPTILKAYDHYLTNQESFMTNKHAVAQLNLIFGIAALSSTVRFRSPLLPSPTTNLPVVVEDQPRSRRLRTGLVPRA